MASEIKLPNLGDNVASGDVIDVKVKVGDQVENGQALIEVEAEKITAEVPTSATGEFRFFAAPGVWTVRALVPGGTADRTVNAAVGEISQVEVAV